LATAAKQDENLFMTLTPVHRDHSKRREKQGFWLPLKYMIFFKPK
jgi:hypothetical protein